MVLPTEYSPDVLEHKRNLDYYSSIRESLLQSSLGKTVFISKQNLRYIDALTDGMRLSRDEDENSFFAVVGKENTMPRRARFFKLYTENENVYPFLTNP